MEPDEFREKFCKAQRSILEVGIEITALVIDFQSIYSKAFDYDVAISINEAVPVYVSHVCSSENTINDLDFEMLPLFEYDLGISEGLVLVKKFRDAFND